MSAILVQFHRNLDVESRGAPNQKSHDFRYLWCRSRRRESAEQAERGPQSWYDFMAIRTPNSEEHRFGSLTTSAT